MKVSTNKNELKRLDACVEGYETFIKAHGDNEAKLSECLDSNGWNDVWWLILRTYEQFTEEQKHDLRVFGCQKSLINIEMIKPYCSEENYKLITDYLNNPTEAARSAAESAARSAAWSAESAAISAARSAAISAAWSAAWSAWSAESAAISAAESAAISAAESAAESAAISAESAAMKKYTQDLKKIFIKWEKRK
jgi:hypothetical protein